jgi:hypothetical protein
LETGDNQESEMSKTISFTAYGYGKTPADKNSMFLCGRALAEIWDHEFPYDSTWTVCLRKRTAKGRRPYKEAIKLDIPEKFESLGIRHELNNGEMSAKRLLVCESDDMVNENNLRGEYWAWIEMDV